MKTEIPEWASSVDEYGNATCKQCGHVQSEDFKACIKCCTHDELEFIEDGEHAAGGGIIRVLRPVCKHCRADMATDVDMLNKAYAVVRREGEVGKTEYGD